MFGLRPEVNISLFPRKNKNSEESVPAPKIDIVETVEAVATKIGTKAVIGASVVSVVTVAAATVGSIAVLAVKHALEK